MGLKLDRIAMAPVRAAARSGRGILADEAERAVDAVFAGPMPEAIGRSLADHHVLERLVSEFVETAAQDGIDAESIELGERADDNDGRRDATARGADASSETEHVQRPIDRRDDPR